MPGGWLHESGLRGRKRASPSWGVVIAVVVGAAGFVLGSRPLRDNSFLTHLATGRIILESGSVPSHDPYTATAAGEPWVVQSWLASVAYALAEAVGGLELVRVLNGALTATVALIAWRLLRPTDSLVARLGLTVLFFVACAQSWSERPLMIGLVAIGLVALCVEEGWNPRWMVPLGWVWANSHGSHPLGLVYLGLLLLGCWLDRAEAGHLRRVTGWLAAGIALGVVGPLGLEVLVFPLELLSRREVLSGIIEWRAPTFEEVGQQAFLVLLLTAVLMLVRTPSYRRGLVVVGFGAAALTGLRNVPVAALLVLPGLAEGVGDLGSLRASARPRIGRVAFASVVLLAVVAGKARLSGDDLDLRSYPVEALALLEQDHPGDLLVTEDFVGNLLSYVHGAGAGSFYDDRFDMFPESVTTSYRHIAAAGPQLTAALDDVGARWVLWERRDPVTTVLLADPDWRAVLLDDRWALLCRRSGAAPPGCR